MDLITQGVLGAAIGQAGFSRKLGKRATVWGALAGMLPDADVLARLFTDEWGDLVWHRGPTHALWFAPLMAPLLGGLLWRWYHRRWTPDAPADHPGDPSRKRAWMWLWFWALWTHPLLDVFTSYGTQLLMPFDRTRFAIDAVSIVDPLYTVPLIAALVLGRVWRHRLTRRVRVAAVALALTTGYLGYATWLNHRAEAYAARYLEEDGRPAHRVDAYPTFMQPWLRRVVAWGPGGAVHVGDLSLWTMDPPRLGTWVAPPDPRFETLRATPEGALFVWFSNNTLFGQIEGDRVRLIDLRYGLPGQGLGGIWGVEAQFDAQGAIVGAPRRYDRRGAGNMGAAWRYLWARTFGSGPVGGAADTP